MLSILFQQNNVVKIISTKLCWENYVVCYLDTEPEAPHGGSQERTESLATLLVDIDSPGGGPTN